MSIPSVTDDLNFFKREREDEQAQAQALAEVLHAGGQWRHFWTPNGGADGTAKRSRWIPAGAAFTPLASWDDKNNYFTVNPTAVRRADYEASTNDTVAAVNALYAEFDGKDFIRQDEWLTYYTAPHVDGLSAAQVRGKLHEAQTAAIDAAYKANPTEYKTRALAHIHGLPVRPSALWDSGGGYQGVWLLTHTIPISDDNRKEIADLQKAWVQFVGGDPGAGDLRRVLRWPGSVNRKPKYAPHYPRVSFLWCDLHARYTLAELRRHLPEVHTPTPRASVYTPDHISLPAEAGHVPTLPHHPKIDAFNAATPIRDLLIAYGYTEAASGRLSRPGGDSGGVQINSDNTATIYSSGDPLYTGGPRVSPALARCVWEYGGDVGALLTALGINADRDQAARFRHWVHTAAAAQELRAGGVKRIADYRKLLDALAEVAVERYSVHPAISTYALAERTNTSAESVRKKLRKLAELGIVDYAPQPRKAPTIGLCTSDLKLADLSLGGHAESANFRSLYAEHRADDAFVPTSWAHKQRRQAADLPTERGLSSTALSLWAELGARGQRSVPELVAVTGYTAASIRRALHRMDDLGLHVEWEGRRHDLHPDAEVRLDEVRPTLASHGIGAYRAYRAACAAATWCQRQLTFAARHGGLDPGERERLERRRERTDAQALIWYDLLAGMGIDLHARVKPTATPEGVPVVGRPSVLHFDAAEEWRSKYARIYQQWQDLGDGDRYSKTIQMAIIFSGGEPLDDQAFRKLRNYAAEQVDIALSLAQRVGRWVKPAAQAVAA